MSVGLATYVIYILYVGTKYDDTHNHHVLLGRSVRPLHTHAASWCFGHRTNVGPVGWETLGSLITLTLHKNMRHATALKPRWWRPSCAARTRQTLHSGELCPLLI